MNAEQIRLRNKQVVIGSVAAVLVVVLVIALAGRRPGSQNNVSSGRAESGAKGEEARAAIQLWREQKSAAQRVAHDG